MLVPTGTSISIPSGSNLTLGTLSLRLSSQFGVDRVDVAPAEPLFQGAVHSSRREWLRRVVQLLARVADRHVIGARARDLDGVQRAPDRLALAGLQQLWRVAH